MLSSAFAEFERHIGVRTFVTPRITYFIKQKLFVDLNIPICITEMEYSEERNNDPSIKAAKMTAYNFNGFPKMFSARLGLGIKI